MCNIAMFEDMDFDLIKLSLKSSNVPTMINAYRLISAKTGLPAAPGCDWGRNDRGCGREVGAGYRYAIV